MVESPAHRFRQGEFSALLSAVTAAEVEQAPEAVREVHDELARMGSEVLLVTGEVMELLAAYEGRQISFHQSSATTCCTSRWQPSRRRTSWSSWNFRHIVRLDRIRQFNSVNIELGYKQLAIYSPREVAPHETND